MSWLFAVYLFAQGWMVVSGGIVTFGMVVQILSQLWLGHAVDRGAGRIVAHLARGLGLAQAIGKTFCPLSLGRILTLEGLSGATDVHHGLACTTTMYNTGKGSNDPFWYWLFAESAFDVGKIIGAGAVAVLLYLGVPLQLTIAVSLPGIIAVWRLTSRYFPKKSSQIAASPLPGQ